MAPPAPSPKRILRSHSSQINCLSFSSLDLEGRVNERLYSGDAEGKVIVTSTTTIRTLASWKAHREGLLGIEEWDDCIISHGKDNKIHVWKRVIAAPTLVETASSLDEVSPPHLQYSLDVNALNFCRFALRKSGVESNEALLAVPNLVESSQIDIWTLPSCKRIHAAIGSTLGRDSNGAWETEGRGENKTGMVMSLHLYSEPHPSQSTHEQLRLIAAYENGGVIIWAYQHAESQVSIEGRGWEIVWQNKSHVESVMAMEVSPFCNFALTTSADHLLVKYLLHGDQSTAGKASERANERVTIHRGRQAGNSAIAIKDDARVCAVGGWDGRIRLYSTKSLKPLGTLTYHKTACNAVSFAHAQVDVQGKDTTDDGEFTEEEREQRSRWLVGGGQDGRISVWELMKF